MKQKLSIVTLGVADLAVSRKFYEETLGFVLTDGSEASISFYDMGGVLLGLFEVEALAKDAQVTPRAAQDFRGVTLAHNEPSKEAVDELFADLRDKGVEIIKEPEEVFWGGYSGYFADPDGHLWEVAYNPFMDLT